jgi:hypothetical protein
MPSGSVSLEAYWYARPFIPTKANLVQISLYLERVGAPTDLEGYVRDDSNGLPYRDVAYFKYSSSYVENAGWYPIEVGADLVVGNQYWIVLKKNGDASNTYRWYYVSSTTDEYATSSDGETWTLTSNTNGLCYKTYYGIDVVMRKVDYDSISKYGERVHIVTDETITDMDTAKMIAEAMLAYMSKPHIELDELEALNILFLPELGSLVGVYLPRINVDDLFEVKEIKFDFPAGEEVTTIRLRLGDTVTKLFLSLAEMKKTLDITRVGKVGEGVLTVYKPFSDSISYSDNVTIDSWAPTDAVVCADDGSVPAGKVAARTGFSEVVSDA